MAQSGSSKTKIVDARDPIGNEMKAITIDDAEATNLEEEEEEGVVEDAEKSLFDLFNERKRSEIMKRLENISDDDLSALKTDEGEECSILDLAVHYGDLDLTKMLLEETNYTVIPNYRCSPLMTAVVCCDLDIVQYLVDKLNTSMDFNYTTSYGLTVLHMAARYQMNDVLNILAPIIAGQVDILSQDGETPLMCAVKGNNERGVEILIRAGADIHHKSQDGKTALYYASADGFEGGVKLLLKAGALIDIKDNEGKYVIQAAASNDIKAMIHLERLTRALYPVHIVARNGDLKALQKWLSAATLKGPGQKQVWHGKHLQNGDSTDIDLQLKLVRDTEIYKIVGTFADDCGVYHLSGEWNAPQLQIKKSYVDIKRIVEYDGEVNDDTGEWTGEYKTGDESADGKFKFSIPFFQCSQCSSKVPEENVLCFTCESVETREWKGEILKDGQWEAFEIEFAIREDVPAKLYRLTRPGYDPSDSDFYNISGTLKDGSIKFAQHYGEHSVYYRGEYEHETKKWIGKMDATTGGTNLFRIDIPVWPCTTCGTHVPNENAKCLKCCHDSIYNWKGEIREDGEWHDMGLFVAVVRDVENGQYRLIGEGTDGVGDFDAFGSWEGNQITMTKVYPEHTVEFTGHFDESSKIWSGRWIGLEEASDDFRINIPPYTCYKCEAFVPIQNELCLNCSDEVPEWNPRNGSLRHAWVGQCRQDSRVWGDEFCVKVLRDLATDSYRFAGFDTNAMGYFASSGTWKGDDIHMDRIFPTMTAVLDGKYDPAKSEWSGLTVFRNFDGEELKGKMRYTIPTWPCTRCSKPVPIEDTLCFSCDKTPRHTVQPLELPFELDNVRRQIQAQVHISELLNQQDRLGRTVLMYAAENGHLGILEELLLFMSPEDIRTNDNVGMSALDIAVAGKLVCAKDSQKLSNDERLNCIELIRRRSCLQILPADIPNSFQKNMKCCGDCAKTNKTRNSEEADLCKLADKKNWKELESILSSPVSGEILNASNKGTTVTHLVCREGKTDILKLLLEQTQLNLEEFDEAYKYPLYEAMKNDHVGCVELLLRFGVSPMALEAYESYDYQISLLDEKAECYQLIMDTHELMEREDLRLYYLANVPSIQAAEKHKQAKESALHAAILRQQSKNVVDKLTQEGGDLVYQKDEKGNTALMLAACENSKFSEDYIEILISRGAEIDATNTEGRTALMMAALAGHVDIVKKLLEKQAEIDIQDLKKKTCLDLLSEFDRKASNSGKKTAIMTQYEKIKDLLTAEKQSRANTVEFRDKLVQALVGMTRDEAFLKGGFRKAINCSPSLARTFLDDCVVINRHDITFSALEKIYGQLVETSVLHSVIELKTDDPDFIMEARKECLEHVVMRRVMQIKWEIFGQRKYIEQLMMNMLLLVASTVSSIIFDGDELKVSSGAVILGISAVVFTVLSFIFVQFLRPQSLWRLARYLHDGSFTLDPHLEIPDLAVKKGRAKVLLVQIVLFLTAALVVPLLYLMDGLNLVKYFPIFNNGVLWLTVSFFLVTEINEARAGVLKYFKSDINKAQMTIYLVIFFVFVPLKLNLVTLGQSHDTLLAIEIGIGSFISIMLWVLTVQFLEVVPSASYLLPMMSNLLNDVWNFFILFGVFQMGLTITFYQLFKKTGDDSFGTLTQSFITTYFVAFGELPLDSLNSFKDKDGNANKNEFLSACAVVLIMFHAAVVVILLLNVLLAMMNKTVDSGFEKAKTEALASYAKCILRLEESMNNNEHENIAMINFKDTKGKHVLNPIFDENVPKSSIEMTDEQEAGIDAYQEKKKVWLGLMTKLQKIVGEEFTTFDKELLHVQHFVTFGEERILPRERYVVKQTRDLIIALIEHSKNSRGQDSERSLTKLGESLKRELKRFDDKIKREWTSKQQTDEHKKCTVLHQMIYKVAIADRMNALKTNIQAHLESAISEAKTNAVVAPTLHDVIERFDMVEGILKNAKPADLSNGEENEQVELHKKVAEIAKQTEKLSTQMESSVAKVDALTKQIEDMAKQVESSALRLEQLMQLMMDKTTA